MSNATSTYADSIAFLRLLYPAGLWALASFPPDRKGPGHFVTFHPDQAAAAEAWIAQENGEGRRQVYYHLNPLRPGEPRKASKTDVAAVAYLHVDIDPRSGEDRETERKRIRGLLLEQRPKGVPQPTFVIDSGNGMQALWRLEQPIALGPDSPPEGVERYTRWLEVQFGADSTHNVDRILRLPGTTNWKSDKGRVPAPARLELAAPDRAYPLMAFEQLPAMGDKPAVAATTEANKPLGPVQRLASLDELPKGVSAKARVVIVQGHDPDEPGKFGASRSEWLYYACCELVRGGCNDDTVYAVITDPQFGISASVLDKGRNAAKYALRQIERAKDMVVDDAISRINRQYFAALEGQKVTFYREEADGTITAMNAEAFGFELGDQHMQVSDGKGGTREVDAVKAWKASPRRRYYRRGFVLDPTDSQSDDQYNLWKGYGVPPAPGDWSLMRRHIEQILASGNPGHADYILRWTAWTLQNPATPPRVALVFRGDEGVGKGIFTNALVNVFGPHGLRVQDMNQVAGRFNSHLRHCCLLFADEVALVSDEQEGTLKGMITEPTLPIEAKGKDIVRADNHLHIVMASNREWVIPAGIGARRFAMFDVPPTYKGNADYFARLVDQLRGGGLSGMLHDLLAMDLGRWHPESSRPDTAALLDQKARSLPVLERFWLDCLMTGTLPCGAALSDGAIFLPTEQFRLAAAQQSRREDISANMVQSLFAKLGFAKRDRSRPRGWEIPPLAQARKAWQTARFPVVWDGATQWDVTLATPTPDRVTEEAPAF